MHFRRIAITGAAGFIGSNLAHSLAGDNELILIDNLTTGHIENMAPILDRNNVNFIQGSVTDLQMMEESFKGVDFVLHQAAIPSVPRSIRNPAATNEANITGTLHALIAARDCGVKKFVYASSSSVYGDTPTLPKTESMPTNPQSPYAMTKMVGEKYCQFFTQLYGLKTVCLRYFNVYGPRQDPLSEYAAVIPRFISVAKKNEPLTIHGDGEQTRDFTFIEDVVAANILAAESEATGTYNIAFGRHISINQLANLILKLIGSKSVMNHENIRAGDVKHSLADISQARNAFGFAPSWKIEDGLEKTIEWFINLDENR